eukprot:352648-Chlamydomonas_euryale.AAC.5
MHYSALHSATAQEGPPLTTTLFAHCLRIAPPSHLGVPTQSGAPQRFHPKPPPRSVLAVQLRFVGGALLDGQLSNDNSIMLLSALATPAMESRTSGSRHEWQYRGLTPFYAAYHS